MDPFLEDVELGIGRAKHPYGGVAFERRIRIGLQNHPMLCIELNYADCEKMERADITLKPGDASYLDLLRVLFFVREKENIELAIWSAAQGAGLSMTGIKVKLKDFHYGWVR